MTMYQNKVIAEEYKESVTEYDPADMDEKTFMNAEVIEIDYVTQRGSVKTVRGDQPREPGVVEPDDMEIPVFGHGDEKYGYDAEAQKLITADRSRDEQAVLAEGDEIQMIRWIEYPKHVPVEGAPQTGVEAKVYFRSKRSGNIKTKTIEVSSIEASYEGPVDRTSSSSIQFSGENKADGRRITAHTAWDRELLSRGRQDVVLGKVVRVEFPLGHRFTVDLRNLVDEKTDVAEEKLENYARQITERYSENVENEISVEVTHEGRIPDE